MCPWKRCSCDEVGFGLSEARQAQEIVWEQWAGESSWEVPFGLGQVTGASRLSHISGWSGQTGSQAIPDMAVTTELGRNLGLPRVKVSWQQLWASSLGPVFLMAL
jgi:hypothetical protein